jgi:hypothetical protein
MAGGLGSEEPQRSVPLMQDRTVETDEGQRVSLVAAYGEVCRAYERIDDFRAKLLGFLPVVSGAGLFLLLGRAEEGSPALGAAVDSGGISDATVFTFSGVFGAVVTIGLLCYEERGIQSCVRLVTVGQELETAMGVHGRFLSRPRSVLRLVNEPLAAGVVYSTVTSAWIFLAILSSSVVLATVAAALAGVVIFFLTRAFYWWVTFSEEQRRGQRPSDNGWYRRWPFEPGRKLRREPERKDDQVPAKPEVPRG